MVPTLFLATAIAFRVFAAPPDRIWSNGTQNLVRCDDSVWRKRTADVYGADICWIIDIRQGSPIKRVGKNSVHGFLLGTP
jgi:hypothetical protein